MSYSNPDRKECQFAVTVDGVMVQSHLGRFDAQRDIYWTGYFTSREEAISHVREIFTDGADVNVILFRMGE